jgi:hypothetical protein
MANPTATDMDSPWKEAVEYFLNPFLALFFPATHKVIDWSKGYVSLDKELHQIVRDADIGKRLADKLFKVWRVDGEESWLLVHIEVQGSHDAAFAERMFVYNYRTYDRYQRPVASLAVLGDADPDWRPEGFGYNIGGSEMGIRFLVTKLLDYVGKEEKLQQDRNVFAPVVLAQLRAAQTRNAPGERQTWKLRLIKSLYERDLEAEEIRQLFRLLDWILVLPTELEQEFRAEIGKFEEERNMPYVTSVERLAKEEGRQEGLQEGLRKGLLEAITLLLETKFPDFDKRQLEDIRAVSDVRHLRKVARALKKAKTAAEVRRLLR